MTQHHIDPTRKKTLSNAKRALLERRLRGDLNSVTKIDTIPVRDGTEPIPLSDNQARIWFLCQLDPQSPVYNMYNVVRFKGVLNVEILRDSFQELIRRHEVLRTSIVSVNGQPYQQIASQLDFDIPVTDFSPLPRTERDIRSEELITKVIRRPFDLTKNPLLRASVLKQADDEFILIFTIHHIIFDEWSNELFWRELSTIYRAFSSDQTPSLPDLPVQYADFTLWQTEQLNKQMATQLAYWKKQLDIELSLLRLPTDRPRPAQQTFHGASKWLRLPDPLSSKLRSLNQAFGTTTFMTMLAAFQLLLHRYTGQADVLVGTPIANRSRPETKELIGLFLNTLVMRANLADDLPFDEFMKQIRQTALDGYAHQDLPFEKLVDELQPHRDVSHNPIFQVMFVHQKSALDEIDLPNMTASRVPVNMGVAKFDLTLFVQEDRQGLSAGLEYNTDLFNSDTAERMLGHFQALLENIVENPQQRVSELQLISDVERETLLHKWNNTATATIPDSCIHHLIEEHAVQKPETVAVLDDTAQLTYRELDQRANQLAHYLQKLGVKPDTPVGLVLERSTDMILAILGVLKAGGAYLPLDPAYPAERLAFMLADTQAPVVLTHKKLADSLPQHQAKTVLLDGDWGKIAQERSDAPHVAVSPANLAYVIYTSGSTGKPKGVPVSHQNLVHSTSARFHFYEKAVDRFLLLSSFTFDSSMVGIFWTLCQGGTLVLPPPRIELDIQQLAATISSHQISHMLMLPSLYIILLEQAKAAQLASLQTVIVAGEECRQDLVTRHYTRLPQATLFNEYGPTEGTVWSTAYKISPGFDGSRVPIGRPIPNVQNYILDTYGQLAPIGVPGELCISGPGVTAGYLNRPELTAQRFIETSFAGEPSVRLYRTGDLARYLSDGNIEFLGRIDHQVKIRGNRVEIGEVEVVLSHHEGVHEVVVVAQEDASGDTYLVAYLVPGAEPRPTVTDLRSYLKQKLAEYMIPTAFVMLDELPLTPNGKVDRQALPAPENIRHDIQETYIAPRDELELQLTKIWENVLNVRPIGIQDDFFDLGGHSLLAVRLFAELEKVFGKNLPLATLFQAPTIEQLVEIVRDEGWRAPWTSLVPIQPQGSKPPFFCVHAVGGNVLSLRDLAQHLGTDQPFYALQSQGLNGKERPPTRVEEMAAYYIEEMRTVQPEGPYYLGGQSSGGLIAFEMAQQLQAQGEKVAILVLIDTHDPIDDKLSVTVPLRNKISFHLNAFSQLGSTYVLEWIRYRIKRIKFKLERSKAEIVKKIYARLERPLPQSVRYTYVREVIRQAIKSYTPQSYEGRITLFRATNTLQAHLEDLQRSQRGWNGLATEGLETYDIPGAHNLEKEPYVGILAKKLSTCIGEAQITISQQATNGATQRLDNNKTNISV